MSTIPATNAYRKKVAQAAALGGYLPGCAYIAFGRGTTPPSVDDTGLQIEVYRTAPDSVSVDGTVLTVTGTLLGTQSTAPITEVGIIADDGTLMGRRTFGPKTLETESSLEFTLHFQY